MPHLVSLLRPSAGNISSIKTPATRSRATSRTTSQVNSRNTSRNPSPHHRRSSSGHEDHAFNLFDLAEALKKHHPLSLHFCRPAKDHHSQAHQTYSPATLDWKLESPSIVLFGTPEESTGALVSGQLVLGIKEDVLDIESFTASLELVVTHKRPFHTNCSDCQTQTTIIKRWKFLSHLTTMGNGKHHYPFSTLLDGRLPASVNTPVVSISYVLRAEAVVATATPAAAAAATDAHTSSIITFEQTLDVKRSLPEPFYPHNSVRVFPPTNIKAAASYKSILDSTGSNTMTFKLDGLLTHNEKFGTVDLWRLKRMTWKLEETIKTVAPACEKHKPSPPGAVVESDNKGLPRSETRIIGEGTLHEGWKSDYTGNDGTLDMEFEFCVNRAASGNGKGSSNGQNFACDVSTDDGNTTVSHSLSLELVVGKEYAQEGKTHVCHQTGTGRILRMHFAVLLTHNAGMGLSWDNEAPPMYEDVPPSPPSYQWEEEPIEYDDLEELNAAGAATAPNSRRHSQVIC